MYLVTVCMVIVRWTINPRISSTPRGTELVEFSRTGEGGAVGGTAWWRYDHEFQPFVCRE